MVDGLVNVRCREILQKYGNDPLINIRVWTKKECYRQLTATIHNSILPKKHLTKTVNTLSEYEIKAANLF